MGKLCVTPPMNEIVPKLYKQEVVIHKIHIGTKIIAEGTGIERISAF